MTIKFFGKGIHNVIENDKIPESASSGSLGWRTKESKIELARGRAIIGETENGLGKVAGHHFGYTNNGKAVHFRKISTEIQYLNEDSLTWITVITGLTEDAFYSFSNYSSLSGSFIYITGIDGIFKIAPSSPQSYSNLTDILKSPTGTKDYGNSFIALSRMHNWNLIKSPTTQYLSKIDNVTYDDILNENITILTGVLSFKSTKVTKTCFNIVFKKGSLRLIDDNNGNLTGDGTGTINYTTGEYEISWNHEVSETTTVDYSWEDSNDGGITDFTFASPRIASDGDFFPQEFGGSKILNVIPFNGRYYSIKETCIYELYLTPEDLNATNKIYNPNIGSLSRGSSIATSLGVVFMDTSNPDFPKLVRMQYNRSGDQLIPVDLVKQFDFSKYKWDECVMETYGEDIIFTGKENSERNNRLFRYNVRLRSIDAFAYEAQTFAKNSGILYTGDSLTNNISKIFNGFDDDESTIQNYWIGKGENFGSDDLKRYKWQVIKGTLSKDQEIDIYVSYGNDSFQKVLTIKGSGTYTNKSQAITIGANEIGSTEIGGGSSSVTAYSFYVEFKLRTPKFIKRRLKFVATKIGHADISFLDEKELQSSGSSRRLPKNQRI